MEITEIKTLFKASESKELIKTKSSLLKINKSKTDGQPKDDYESVKTIGTNSSTPGIKQRGRTPNSSGRISSKRLLLTGCLSFLTSPIFNTYLINVSFSLSNNYLLKQYKGYVE